jgi:hypothetical protein
MGGHGNLLHGTYSDQWYKLAKILCFRHGGSTPSSLSRLHNMLDAANDLQGIDAITASWRAAQSACTVFCVVERCLKAAMPIRLVFARVSKIAKCFGANQELKV